MHEVWLPHAPRVVSRLWASHLLVTRVCRNRVQRVCPALCPWVVTNRARVLVISRTLLKKLVSVAGGRLVLAVYHTALHTTSLKRRVA